MKSNRQQLLELIKDTEKPGILASPQFDKLFIGNLMLYFLPLTAIIAELASVNQDKRGGIYS